MDEETIDWVLSEDSIDAVSGVPFSTVVFMLYYGFELHHFFLEISDMLMTRYPLELYDVGRSSVYLGGSCGHGFFLNSIRITDLRDFDIVTILKKYDIRTECEYDSDEQTELYSGEQAGVENERDRDACPSASRLNVTCESDGAYLNVEPSENPGYILLRKCRRFSPAQVSLQQRYVSSSAVMKARFEYWNDAKMFIKQRYPETPFPQQTVFPESGYGSVLSFVDTQGPAVNAFLTGRGFPMTTTLNTDIVIALPYPGWPPQAREWLSRDSKYGWPSEDLKREIHNKIGCMIVPVGHFGSKMEDYQWRVSFSRAEMLLSRSFTRVQRELVHLMKAFDVGGSYHFLNLIYRLSENSPADSWRSKNLGSHVFTIVDQYISCIRSHRLSHYFIPEMNLLAKYEKDFIEVNGRTKPMDEHLQKVLLPLYELRMNPLDMILRQDKHLALPPALRRRVFAPLVDEMKPTGSRNKMIFIDTLVSLAKAHLYKENLHSAYKYAKDALKFSQKLNLDTTVEKKADLYLTAAVCSYVSGDTTSALYCLRQLQPLLNTEEENIRYQSVSDSRRSNFLMLYGRILSIMSTLPLAEKSDALATARKMYRGAMETLVPHTTVYLDTINFFIRLGETDEVDNLITFLSGYLFPDDRCDVTRSSSGHIHTEEGSVEDRGGRPTRDNSNEDVVIERSAHNPNNVHDIHNDVDMPQSSLTEAGQDMSSVDGSDGESFGEGRMGTTTDSTEHVKHMSSRDVPVGESSGESRTDTITDSTDMSSRDVPVGEPSGESRVDHATDFGADIVSDSHIEIVYDSVRHVTEEMSSTSWTPIDYGSSQTTTIRQDMDSDEEQDIFSTIPEEIRYLDAYYIQRTQLAKRYEQIGMHELSNKILTKLKDKLELEHENAERIFPLIVEASKTFEKLSNSDDKIPGDWDDVFHDNTNYLVYCETDLPVVDDIIATVIRRKGGKVKVTHKEALLHFKIQHYKMLHNFARAERVVSVLECVCKDSVRDESRWLLQLHKAYFGRGVSDEDDTHSKQKRSLGVAEEVITRIDQLMDVIKAHEIRNSAMDDIFNFSDY